MKKILSVIISISLILSSVSVFAETDTTKMESSLISVKNKIEIPAELEEFTVGNDYKNKENESYTFKWKEKENNNRLEVMADADGHVLSYYRYFPDMYTEKKITGKSREEFFAVAESFIKKAAPELFADSGDCLELIDYDKAVVRYGTCDFTWQRMKNGIPVLSNGAHVAVQFTKGGELIVQGAEITWDYDTDFAVNEGNELSNPVNTYFEKYPFELIYAPEYRYDAKSGTEKFKLKYRFTDNEMGFIDAYTGEIVEEDIEAGLYRFAGGGASNAKTEEAAADVALSPAEISELEKVEGLVSAEELVSKANEMKYFGTLTYTDEAETRLYNTEDGYRISASSYNDKSSYSVTGDAETGTVLALRSYEYSGYDEEKEYTDADYAKAKTATESLLNTYYADYISQCTELKENKEYGYTVSCTRFVNGVKAISDNIRVTYDMDRGVVSNFSLSFTKDLSAFPSRDNVIAPAMIQKIILEKAPINKKYIKSDGVFRLCYSPDASYPFDIDAITGETSIDDLYVNSYVYTDISGHWAEAKINAIAETGAGIGSQTFNPDSPITQKNLLTMLYAGIRYPLSPAENIYERLGDDISKLVSENPDSPVTREEAFTYMTAFMGYSEIAAMTQIFITDFADNSNISEDKIGSAAILRGMGIISGDGVSVRPKDYMTNAEAAVMLYNYLVI